MKSRPAICALVVAAAVFVTFGRTITFDFVGGWDDGPLIVDNPLINPPTGEGLSRIWRGPHARMYIPAVYTTWWTLARVAGVEDVEGRGPGEPALNPYIFHLANVIVHALAALMVFAILRILVRRDWPAAAAAILFAVHPLQVEAVAWATGMKDLLAGMLSVAAIWQYLEFTTASESRRRTLHYALATAAFALALLAKPSSVVVPFMLIAIEWLMLRRPIGRTIGVLLPWVALSAAWMLLTAHVQPTPEIAAPPLFDRLIIALNALGHYVLKLIWPATLGIDYGQRPEVLVHRALLWITIAAAAVVAVTRSRWLIGAALIFVIAVLPTLGLRPFVFQWLSTVADRYAYLALLGPAIAAAVALAEWRGRRTVVAAAAAFVLLALAVRSFVQAGVWSDGETLMRHALIVNPDSPVAHNQLGDLLYRANDVAGAQEHFAHAVRVRPDYLIARDNLALTLARQGRAAEALELMKQTLAMRRALPPAIAQPIDQDLEHIAAVERALAATKPASR